MTSSESVQVWVLDPDGHFIKQKPRPEPEVPFPLCEDCDDEPHGPDAPVLFGDEPWVICPCCDQPIRKGDVTVPLKGWDPLYEDQDEEYPLYGFTRLAHLSCLIEVFGERNAD